MEKTALTGTVLKTLVVPAYEAEDFAAAVRLGNFDNRDGLGGVVYQFRGEYMGLAVPVQVELVEFDHNWRMAGAIAWGEAHGNKEPIDPTHLLGIAIGFPDEQRERPIMALGSISDDNMVLCICGASDWRGLDSVPVEGDWNRRCLAGFVSLSA